MTEIILARHGQTAWNTEEVFRGQTDIALDETGLQQAALLGEYLSARPLEAIYSSPLQRALQTAAAIARHHKLTVIPTAGLNDLHFGVWQGMPVRQVRAQYREIFAEWSAHPHRVRVPGGEMLAEVRSRATALVSEVVAEHQGTVVLVSHRVVHKVLILALLGLDDSHFWTVRLDTCAITTFNHENNRFILTEHNNTAYLKPLQKPGLKDF